jgi:hypothetical protein
VRNLTFSNETPYKFIYPTKQNTVKIGSLVKVKVLSPVNDWWVLFYKKIGGTNILLDSAYKASGDTINSYWDLNNYQDTGKYQLCIGDGSQLFYSDTFRVVTIPTNYKLNELRSFDVYPNPFENNLAVAFESIDNSKVEIDMYDLLGKKIKSIYSGIFPYGKYSQFIDCSGFQSGVYIIQMKTITGITKQIVVKK